MQPFNVYILGCASATPTLRHYPSSQLVEIRGKLFMIDCGEGTQLQLRRVKVAFSKLGWVLISHLHGDHCLGLIGMISTFGLMGREAPLHIYAPAQYSPLLDMQLQFYCPNLSFVVVFHPLQTEKPEVIYEDRSLTVETIPLCHRVPTCGFLFREKPSLPHINRERLDYYGISLSQINNIKAGAGGITPDGQTVPHQRLVTPPDTPRSYAYCSDTKYLPDLHLQLRHTDVIYHESTYADEDLTQAEKYCHSTASQAAQVAKDAQAKRLYIGHYSARYTDETLLLNQAKAVFPETYLTDEMMKIQV